MIEKIKQNKLIFILFLTGLVYLFFKYICPLVLPVLVAFLFIFACHPFLEKAQKKTHVPKSLWALCILLILFIFVGGILWFIVSKCLMQIPVWLTQADMIENQVCRFVKDCCHVAGAKFGFDSVNMEMAIFDNFSILLENFEKKMVPGLIQGSWTYAGYLLKIGAFIAVMIISVILLAKDYEMLIEKVNNCGECKKILELVKQVLCYVGTYMKAQLVILTCISILTVIILYCLKIDNALFLGILAGFLDMLPFIGTGIVLIPLTIWQLINGMYAKAVLCFLLYIACALLRECLEPKLIGRKLGIYPIAILLAIYAGVKLFGLWGILAGPLAFVIIYQTYRILK